MGEEIAEGDRIEWCHLMKPLVRQPHSPRRRGDLVGGHRRPGFTGQPGTPIGPPEDRSSERFAIDGKVRRTWAAVVGDHPSSEPDLDSSDGKRSDMDIQSIISLLLSAGSSVLSLGSSVLSL